MIFRRRRYPAAPQNVTLTKSDGTTIPVEVVYAGKENGQHIWTNVHPVSFEPWNGDGLSADLLPAKTSIRIMMNG